MELKKFTTHDEMSRHTAKLIADEIESNPTALLCLAAGHTQIETYAYLAEAVTARNIDCSKISIVGLDDWVNFGIESVGSCIAFINANVFEKIGITKNQYFFFDGHADDINAECKKADDYIDSKGAISLTILGVGLNGHLGFNEPGVYAGNRSHIIELSSKSIEVSSKYFGETVEVKYGISLGLKDLFASKNIIIQCTGKHKSDITATFLNGEISNQVPASLVRNLSNASVFIDEESATKL